MQAPTLCGHRSHSEFLRPPTINICPTIQAGIAPNTDMQCRAARPCAQEFGIRVSLFSANFLGYISTKPVVRSGGKSSTRRSHGLGQVTGKNLTCLSWDSNLENGERCIVSSQWQYLRSLGHQGRPYCTPEIPKENTTNEIFSYRY